MTTDRWSSRANTLALRSYVSPSSAQSSIRRARRYVVQEQKLPLRSGDRPSGTTKRDHAMNSSDPKNSLTNSEAEHRKRLQAIFQRVLDTYVGVGPALADIGDA